MYASKHTCREWRRRRAEGDVGEDGLQGAGPDGREGDVVGGAVVLEIFHVGPSVRQPTA